MSALQKEMKQKELDIENKLQSISQSNQSTVRQHQRQYSSDNGKKKSHQRIFTQQYYSSSYPQEGERLKSVNGIENYEITNNDEELGFHTQPNHHKSLQEEIDHYYNQNSKKLQQYNADIHSQLRAHKNQLKMQQMQLENQRFQLENCTQQVLQQFQFNNNTDNDNDNKNNNNYQYKPQNLFFDQQHCNMQFQEGQQPNINKNILMSNNICNSEQCIVTQSQQMALNHQLKNENEQLLQQLSQMELTAQYWKSLYENVQNDQQKFIQHIYRENSGTTKDTYSQQIEITNPSNILSPQNFSSLNKCTPQSADNRAQIDCFPQQQEQYEISKKQPNQHQKQQQSGAVPAYSFRKIQNSKSFQDSQINVESGAQYFADDEKNKKQNDADEQEIPYENKKQLIVLDNPLKAKQKPNLVFTPLKKSTSVCEQQGEDENETEKLEEENIQKSSQDKILQEQKQQKNYQSDSRQIENINQLRIELAACYKLSHWFRFANSNIMQNNISVLIQGKTQFLVAEYGLRSEEVTPFNLVIVDLEENRQSADKHNSILNIHKSIFLYSNNKMQELQQDQIPIQCVFYSNNSVAHGISCLKEGLKFYSHDAFLLFKDKIAYFDIEGSICDVAWAKLVSQNIQEDKNVIVIKNQGIIFIGNGVIETFILTYNFMIIAREYLHILQNKMDFIEYSQQSGNQQVNNSQNECIESQRKKQQKKADAVQWAALLRKLDQIYPNWRAEQGYIAPVQQHVLNTFSSQFSQENQQLPQFQQNLTIPSEVDELQLSLHQFQYPSQIVQVEQEQSQSQFSLPIQWQDGFFQNQQQQQQQHQQQQFQQELDQQQNQMEEGGEGKINTIVKNQTMQKSNQSEREQQQQQQQTQQLQQQSLSVNNITDNAAVSSQSQNNQSIFLTSVPQLKKYYQNVQQEKQYQYDPQVLQPFNSFQIQGSSNLFEVSASPFQSNLNYTESSYHIHQQQQQQQISSDKNVELQDQKFYQKNQIGSNFFDQEEQQQQQLNQVINQQQLLQGSPMDSDRKVIVNEDKQDSQYSKILEQNRHEEEEIQQELKEKLNNCVKESLGKQYKQNNITNKQIPPLPKEKYGNKRVRMNVSTFFDQPEQEGNQIEEVKQVNVNQLQDQYSGMPYNYYQKNQQLDSNNKRLQKLQCNVDDIKEPLVVVGEQAAAASNSQFLSIQSEQNAIIQDQKSEIDNYKFKIGGSFHESQNNQSSDYQYYYNYTYDRNNRNGSSESKQHDNINNNNNNSNNQQTKGISNSACSSLKSLRDASVELLTLNQKKQQQQQQQQQKQNEKQFYESCEWGIEEEQRRIQEKIDHFNSQQQTPKHQTFGSDFPKLYFEQQQGYNCGSDQKQQVDSPYFHSPVEYQKFSDLNSIPYNENSIRLCRIECENQQSEVNNNQLKRVFQKGTSFGAIN